MIKSILSVLAGAVVWSLLWFALYGVLMAIPGAVHADGSIHSVPVLLLILISSVVMSVLAGYLTARLAPSSPIAHGVALGVLQLTLGIYFQTQSWSLVPIWYHLSFLALLLPGNVYGAWLFTQRRRGLRPAEGAA